MKKYFLSFVLTLLIFSYSYSQDIKGVICNPPVPVTDSPTWGADYIVSNTEPMGRPSGVYRASDNKLFVCIPDTSYSSGKGIVCLVSTNNGVNWAMTSFISPAFSTPKVKMVKTGTDSVYCFFLYGTTLYTWNVVTNFLTSFPTYTNLRDFDCEASSTGSLYIIVDININNDIRMYGSANGGGTWAGAVYLTSTAAGPKWSKTIYGDTLLITYFGPVAGLSDTSTAAVRTVRYRETAPGTLTLTGTFATVITAGNPKPQVLSAINGNNAWLFYSQGTTGSIDLYCMVSTNMGVAFGTAFTVTNPPGRDEYWFDAKPYNSGLGGLDLIFYSDSLQSGNPNNNSDKILYTFASNNAPSSFGAITQISEVPPSWSAFEYIPTLIEYPVFGDAGAIWVGVTGTSRKLYFDRLLNVTGIRGNSGNIPDKFNLSQNYPNPFNPVTKVDFSIPKKGFVTIKIFDILGKEVDELVNKEFSAGTYSVSYDASKLSSGTYFYKLTSGSFSETKKMTFVK
jgi:hypothetical protein